MGVLWNGGVQNNSGSWKSGNVLNDNKAKIGALSKPSQNLYYYIYDVMSVVQSCHGSDVKAILLHVCACMDVLWNGGVQKNSSSWKLGNISNDNKAKVGAPSKPSQKLYYYAYDVMFVVWSCHGSDIKAILLCVYVCVYGCIMEWWGSK